MISRDSTPIVVVHKGNNGHLARALAMAVATNPSRETILLGDVSNRALAERLGASHRDAGLFSTSAEELVGRYVHYSSNGADFELLCVQRWFVILEWMKAEGVEKAVCLDSDILLYGPLEDVLGELANRPLSMVIDSAHTLVINERSALEEFCAFINWHYSTPEGVGRVKELYAAHLLKSPLGGVSDMTFFVCFLGARPDLLSSNRGPFGRSGWMFDLTINDGVGGFVVADGFKRIEWRGNVPYCQRVDDQAWAPFITLHFQGAAKKILPRYIRSLSAPVRAWLIVNDALLFGTRIRRKLIRVFLAMRGIGLCR